MAEILELLKTGNYITLEELMVITGMPERAVRQEIAKLRRDYPIINLQDGRGYRLTYDDVEALRKFKKQEEARAKYIFWRTKGVNDALNALENRQ